MSVQHWVPTTDLVILRRMGKLQEELGELGVAAARIVIQGLDGIDPDSGKGNLQRLEEEIADVLAQCNVTIDRLRLDRDGITARAARKSILMAQWEAGLAGGRNEGAQNGLAAD